MLLLAVLIINDILRTLPSHPRHQSPERKSPTRILNAPSLGSYTHASAEGEGRKPDSIANRTNAFWVSNDCQSRLYVRMLEEGEDKEINIRVH